MQPLFEKTHPAHKLVLGSSGKFMQQLENGAPFDIFFSADVTLLALIDHLARETGIPVLFIIHSPQEVERLADGQQLLAEITRYSCNTLALHTGQRMFALVKSVALMG